MNLNPRDIRFSFSGHESFQCRNLWLKKGYDFILNGNSFSNKNAVVVLGVGKNMVASIRYWMKAFDLLNNDDELTELAHKIFSDVDGWDPFLEDEATLWLLHYHLVSKAYATIYHLVFNEFRKGKIEFTKENFLYYIKRKFEVLKISIPSEKTLVLDFEVMIKMYNRTTAQSNDKEETLSGVLSELDVIRNFNRGKTEYFVIENTEKMEIPMELVLYGILKQNNGAVSIDFSTIEQDINSVGNIFALNRTGLMDKIEEMTKTFPNQIVFSDYSGIKQLQFKGQIINPFDVLASYYTLIYA